MAFLELGQLREETPTDRSGVAGLDGVECYSRPTLFALAVVRASGHHPCLHACGDRSPVDPPYEAWRAPSRRTGVSHLCAVSLIHCRVLFEVPF